MVINVNVEIQKPDPVTPPVVQKYKVGYVLTDAEGYFTDDELSKLDTSGLNCSTTYYFGDESNRTKYNYCTGNVTIFDENEYEVGQTVNVMSIRMGYLPQTCYSIRGEEQYCAEPQPAYGELKEWAYSLSASSEHSIEDDSVMNFSGRVTNYWDDFKYFYILTPSTFTMPNHNVYFIHTTQK